MKKDCYIVYTITREVLTRKIVEIQFLNCFETEEQAIASLKYEEAVCREELEEEPEWIDEYTLLLPSGLDESLETLVTYGISAYHDINEEQIDYYKD